MALHRSRYRWFISLLVSAAMLAVFGATGSPYLRVGGGPLIRIGRPAHGSWSVATVRVSGVTWFQWARAEMSGERTFRRDASSGSSSGSGPPDEAMNRAMGTSQTYAAVVAAQLATGRSLVGAAGLQVPEDTPGARAAGLRPGDVLLAAGNPAAMAPLRAPTDLQQATARGGTVRVLVVPKASADTWGAATVRTMPAARLAAVHAGPWVSARAYPLGEVEGPSAGLLLTLARVDDLTAGDLTGGRRISGTGAIGLDGAVGDVGEVAEKVRAAANRADVFFVPAAQAAEAAGAARGTRLRVVPVGSAAEAVRWLCGNGGRAPFCQ